MSSTRRLFLRPEAREDLTEAFRWYEDDSAGLGYDFLRAVRLMLATVERAPEQHEAAIDDIRKAP